MTAEKDIADYLVTLGYGTVGTDIFHGSLPPTPDDVICVIQAGGQKPDPIEDVESPAIQIIVRCADPDDARDIANEIMKDLAGLINTTINLVVYHWIESQGSPSDGGLDYELRKLYTLGFIAMKDME